MKQTMLATEPLGCGAQYLSEMERGLRPIGKKMAKRLGAAQGCPTKPF